MGVPLLSSAAGEAVRFRTRKHFAVLIRLAVEPGRPLTRDHLIELLWGSVPDHLGRHSLAQAITVLRAKLGQVNVLIHRSTIALNAGVVDVDLVHLDDCAVQVHGRFLEGFDIPGARAFEDWRDAWNVRVMPRLRDCLVRHMDAGRRIGDFATVERHASVLAELEPLSEDALRGRMEARAWAGDRTNALKAYAEFEQRLGDELGAKPAPELVRIANLLREGRRSPFRQPSEPAPEAGEKRFEPERLIGREREFGRLYDAWVGVRKRQPCVMVITGDPGVGKTTLTNAFVSTCQMEGAVVARAQAYDAERELPFAVLAELVRQLTIQRAIGSADPEALSELSRICSDVLVAFPGVPKPVEWSAEITPLRLADAFLKTISAAADENALVMVVDDIHAADYATVAILHAVARKLRPGKILIVLIGRSTELRTSDAPASLVNDSSINALNRLDLEPLDSDGAKRLIRALAIGESDVLDERFAAKVQAASNGYPLAIELLMKEWQEHGSMSVMGSLQRRDSLPLPALGIPREIRALFQRQIARLDPVLRSALDLSAILGRRISDMTMYQVVGLSEGGAAESLSRLHEQGWLRDIHGELEFRNELIRAQAYYSVAAPTRQHLHRKIAGLLNAKAGAVSYADQLEAAWHLLRGGDTDSASRLSTIAAEAALGHGAPFEAEQLLVAVLRAGGSGLESNSPHNVLLVRALLDQSKAHAAFPIIDDLEARPGISVQERSRVARMRATATYLNSADDFGEAYLAAASDALSAARQIDDKQLLTEALFEYARSGLEGGDPRRLWSSLNDLLSLEDAAIENHPFRSYALAYCNYFTNRLEGAIQHLRKALGTLEGSVHVVLLSQAYNGLGNALQQMCDFRGALEAYEESLRIVEHIGDDSRASLINANMCAVSVIAGAEDVALQYGMRALAFGRVAGSHPNMGLVHMNLAAAYLLAGDRAAMVDHNKKALAWLGTKRGWRARISMLQENIFCELCMGNVEHALKLIQQIQDLARGREATVPEPGVFYRLTAFRAAHVEGDGAAESIVEKGEQELQGNPLAAVEMLAARAWIELRRTGGRSALETLSSTCRSRGIFGRLRLFAQQGFIPAG